MCAFNFIEPFGNRDPQALVAFSALSWRMNTGKAAAIARELP